MAQRLSSSHRSRWVRAPRSPGKAHSMGWQGIHKRRFPAMAWSGWWQHVRLGNSESRHLVVASVLLAIMRKLQQTQRSKAWCGGNSQSLACKGSLQMWLELLYRVCVRPCVVGHVRPLFTVLVLKEKRRNHSMCALFVTGSSRDLCECGCLCLDSYHGMHSLRVFES